MGINDVDKAHIAKLLAAKEGKGMDTHKRWGNSAIEGHGVNSPAMMEARKKFNKIPEKSAQSRADDARKENFVNKELRGH